MGTFEQVGRFSAYFIGFMSLHILDHQINSNIRLCANHSGVRQNTPPLRPGKSPGIQAQLLAHQSSYKIVCEGFANKPSVANILLSFESMANL